MKNQRQLPKNTPTAGNPIRQVMKNQRQLPKNTLTAGNPIFLWRLLAKTLPLPLLRTSFEGERLETPKESHCTPEGGGGCPTK